MPETLFLPLSVSSNRVLNADEQTQRRRLDLIKGESYAVFLKFLNATGSYTPEIENFAFVVRESASAATDLLRATGLAAGSGDYPFSFEFTADSVGIASQFGSSSAAYKDFSSQIIYTEAGEVEIYAPVTARTYASSSGAGFDFVESVNGATGDLILTGNSGVSVSRAGQTITVSGPDLSSYATDADVAALDGRVDTLEGQTGSFVTTAQTGNFVSTAQTGQFYPAANPSGFINAIPSDVVRTTGNQTISGTKIFAGNVSGTVGGFNISTDGQLTTTTGPRIHTRFGQLFSHPSTGVMNWVSRELQGAWSHVETPTLGTHIINKAYLDNALSVLPFATLDTNQTFTAQKTFDNFIYFTDGVDFQGGVNFGSSVSANEINNGGNYSKIDINSSLLYDASNVQAVDWNSKILSDTSPSVDWASRALYDASYVQAMYWGNRICLDTASYTSIDWNNRNLNAADGTLAIDWANRILKDKAGNTLAEWNDSFGTPLLGFFGASPVSRPNVSPIGDPSSASAEDCANKINELISALSALGLVNASV